MPGSPGFVPQQPVRLASGRSSTSTCGDPERRIALEADSFATTVVGALRDDCRRYDELVRVGWLRAAGRVGALRARPTGGAMVADVSPGGDLTEAAG